MIAVASAKELKPEVIRLRAFSRLLCRTPDETKGLPCPRGKVQNIGQGVRHNPAQSVLSAGTDTNKVKHVRSGWSPTGHLGRRMALENKSPREVQVTGYPVPDNVTICGSVELFIYCRTR